MIARAPGSPHVSQVCGCAGPFDHLGLGPLPQDNPPPFCEILRVAEHRGSSRMLRTLNFNESAINRGTQTSSR